MINQGSRLYPHFFRDGRASSLEEQALEPLVNPGEMGNTHEQVVQTLEGIAGYRRYFAEAFGSEGVTKQRIASALAAYVRTLTSEHSAWDRWRRSHDESAVSDETKHGHDLFFGKAGCNQCHLGGNFTDDSFHNLGVGWNAARGRFADEGRYEVTGRAVDKGAFKTPTLRDVSKHPPYMHDGSLSSLRDVVQWYSRGGKSNPHLDARISPLHLSAAEIDALVAFLRALDGQGPRHTPPVTFPQ